MRMGIIVFKKSEQNDRCFRHDFVQKNGYLPTHLLRATSNLERLGLDLTLYLLRFLFFQTIRRFPTNFKKSGPRFQELPNQTTEWNRCRSTISIRWFI